MNSRYAPSRARGSATHGARYVVQFQLGVLELERARRELERQAARQKVEQVEQRLRQVEALIRERQDALDRDQRYGRNTNRRP